MGYELNKLMRQFGVATPGAVMYSGATVPGAPLEPVKADAASGPGLGATVRRVVNDADYDAAMAKYRAELADYEKTAPQLRAQEAADRAAYNQYLQNYQGRVMNTPQYMDQQYYTGPSAGVRAATAPGGIGMEKYNQNIRDYFATPATGDQVRQAMNQYGVSALDIARARGTPGSMWGNAPVAAPVYTPVPPVAPPPASVVQPPVVQPPVVQPPVVEPPVVEEPVYYGYAHGGPVHDMAQKYNVGGAVRRFQVGGNEGQPDTREEMPMPAVVGRPLEPVTESPAAQPVTPKPAAPTPVSPAANDLMSMLSRYGMDQSVYAPELKAARERADKETKAFTDMIQNAMKGEAATPDKSEMYFRLAAAFGAPTKTGHFAENLGMVGRELGEYAKETRAAKKADQQLKLQLGLEAQKIRAQGAREELSTLRQLTGEEMKDKRALLQEYIKSGRPQSEAGKAAVDAGLTQGTPEFTNFVNKYIEEKLTSGNMLKEAMVLVAQGNLAIRQSAEKRAAEGASKLTPGELKLKSETEDRLTTMDNAMKDLSRAYDLNKGSFDSTLKDKATLAILEQTGSKDPKVVSTQELLNLLKSAMISGAAEKMKGVLSDSDLKLLQSVAGIDAKSREERAQVLKNAYRALKNSRSAQQKRLNEISQGLYRETTSAPGAGGEMD